MNGCSVTPKPCPACMGTKEPPNHTSGCPVQVAEHNAAAHQRRTAAERRVSHRGYCMRCGEDTTLVDLTLDIVDRDGRRFETPIRAGQMPVRTCIDCRDETRDRWNAAIDYPGDR